MDDALSRLERAHAADPDDPTLAVELARARLRAGRPLGALAVLGPLDAGERQAAGEALAAALGLEWLGVKDGTDRFELAADTLRADRQLILVHAGAFLDDGESALASSLLERQERATVRRVEVPAFLASVRPVGPVDERVHDDVRQLGGRLPTPVEWKKLWRGGLYLDGDASARLENPDPDRLLPQGVSPEPGVAARSPYGAYFALRAYEVLQGEVAGVFDVGTGRYLVPIRTPEQRRNRHLVHRVARDVPRHLA